MYIICYSYDTGNSFGSETHDNCVFEHKFHKLETAKENLQRIKEHYKWARGYRGSWRYAQPSESVQFALKQRWCAYLCAESHTFDYNTNSLILIDVSHLSNISI